MNQINNKLAKGLGILVKTRNVVPRQTFRTLYNSFLQSHILYRILNLGSAYATNLEPIKRKLRKAVKTIYFLQR